jgi:hypothetical protein
MPSSALLTLFVALCVPLIVLAMIWAVVTVLRLLLPEEEPVDPPAFHPEAAEMVFGARAVGVGGWQIREAHRARTRSNPAVYTYVTGGSAGLPSSWIEDLARRRN